jgi:acyl-CoA reductase-like NAD-dependent aldehyde dehydrogenase
MNERVKKLAGEARQLSPRERAELLNALTAMVQEDKYDKDAVAVAECRQHWEDIGAESLGYLVE